MEESTRAQDATRGAEPGASGAIRHGLMLQLNEQLVLDFVHEQGSTTRPEIAAALGLSAATVSRIIRRLVERDLAREEPGASTGGRPRSTISFNATSGCVIGIDLGGTKCHAMLADLSGEILVEEVRATESDGSPFETLATSIERLIRHRKRAGAALAAMAVGVPAIVDPATGVAIGGPNVHWQGFPLVSELRDRFDVPLVVDNDVNLASLGHAWKGDARGLSDFVVLSLGTGIGGAVVVDGALLKGQKSGAGEIGFMVLDRSLLRATRDDDLGAFETQASGVGLAEMAREALAATDVASSLRDRADIGSREVLEEALAGDGVASGVVDSMIDYVAMAIIATATVADPETVILDGSVGRGLEPWIPELSVLVSRHIPVPPEIVVSSLGGESTAIGAIAAALDLSRTHRGPRQGPAPAVSTLTRPLPIPSSVPQEAAR